MAGPGSGARVPRPADAVLIQRGDGVGRADDEPLAAGGRFRAEPGADAVLYLEPQHGADAAGEQEFFLFILVLSFVNSFVFSCFFVSFRVVCISCVFFVHNVCVVHC